MKLIDLDALGVGKANPAMFENRGVADGWNSLYSILQLAPVVDAEPVRHGRWVKDDLYNTVCSVCGERIPYIEEYDTDDDCGGTYDVEIDETPRCPICGCKMDGGLPHNVGQTVGGEEDG